MSVQRRTVRGRRVLAAVGFHSRWAKWDRKVPKITNFKAPGGNDTVRTRGTDRKISSMGHCAIRTLKQMHRPHMPLTGGALIRTWPSNNCPCHETTAIGYSKFCGTERTFILLYVSNTPTTTTHFQRERIHMCTRILAGSVLFFCVLKLSYRLM